MNIMEGLSAISAAIGIARDLRQIDKGIDEAEFKLKIADIQSQLADAKIALIDAQDEIASRDSTIERLRKEMSRRADTVQHDGFRYEKQADGSAVGLPFCPRCDEVDGILIRLIRTFKPNRVKECPQCRRDYSVAEFIDRSKESPVG